MKNKSASYLILTGLVVVLVLAASNSIVRAQECPGTSNWIGGTGGWFVGTNWSNGCVPNVTVDAAINNGGHAQILGGPNHAAAESLVLGDNQGQSGSVTIDGDGSAVLDIGGLCRGNIYIGNRGSGNLTITGQGYIRSRYAYVAAVANPTRPTSNGTVTVKGPEAIWYLYDTFNEPACSGAGLFIGCTANSNNGGTATVDVADGATIAVVSLDGATAVKVGLSGTLTGDGLVYIGGVSKAVEVHGTLAPARVLEIAGNLELESTANTVFNVTPQAWDNVQVTNGTGGGAANLGGRITVKMTGNFTAGMSFTLLYADAGLNDLFDFETIIPPSGNPCFTPVITYDANRVKLALWSCADAGAEP